MSAICVERISKQYGDVKALSNVSFSLGKGEVIGYLGPNGSGKTTTLKILTGLLKCDSGHVLVLGNDIYSNQTEYFPRVSVLFDFNGLYEKLTARQNLEFTCWTLGIHKNDVPQKVGDILKDFDLLSVANTKVKTFSKGMKRRLALANTLIRCPEILLLDEPFDGIDIESRETILNILRNKVANEKLSILLTSHVMADIEDLASRIIIIKNGQILADQLSRECFRNDDKTLTQTYLELVHHE